MIRITAQLGSALHKESISGYLKRFDMLLLNLQLAVLRAEPAFERLRDQVRIIAGLLEEKGAIPMVQAQMTLTQDLQTEEWWQDVTPPMLEMVCRRLRDLVKLIEKAKRKPVYTDFEDEMSGEVDFTLPGVVTSGSFERFRNKARPFRRAQQDLVAVSKLRMNLPLTPTDLAELEEEYWELKGSEPPPGSDARRMRTRAVVGSARRDMGRDATSRAGRSHVSSDQTRSKVVCIRPDP